MAIAKITFKISITFVNAELGTCFWIEINFPKQLNFFIIVPIDVYNFFWQCCWFVIVRVQETSTLDNYYVTYMQALTLLQLCPLGKGHTFEYFLFPLAFSTWRVLASMYQCYYSNTNVMRIAQKNDNYFDRNLALFRQVVFLTFFTLQESWFVLAVQHQSLSAWKRVTVVITLASD